MVPDLLTLCHIRVSSVFNFAAYLIALIFISLSLDEGVIKFSGSPKISFCEDKRLKDTQNLKCEDRWLQNCLVLKTDNLAAKPGDWRFEFITVKIWLLSVINWEYDSLWYLSLDHNLFWAGQELNRSIN